MGMVYLSGRKELTYEEFKKFKEKLLKALKEDGFKVDGKDMEVSIRYEE